MTRTTSIVREELKLDPAAAGPRSRPTAVNLADACNKLAGIASAAAEAPGATAQSVVEAVVMTAEAYYQHDIATCKVC